LKSSDCGKEKDGFGASDGQKHDRREKGDYCDFPCAKSIGCKTGETFPNRGGKCEADGILWRENRLLAQRPSKRAGGNRKDDQPAKQAAD
jgi:hypothetical protein